VVGVAAAPVLERPRNCSAMSRLKADRVSLKAATMAPGFEFAARLR